MLPPLKLIDLASAKGIGGGHARSYENERYYGLLRVEKINGLPAEEVGTRPVFEELPPVYPDRWLSLETKPEILSTRLIDLVAPIGIGQRGLIVSPPKAGKTWLLKDIAQGVAANYPEIHLMVVLIGERPEEVTDISHHVEKITGGKGEVAASNFDESPENQTFAAEIALERAKRLVEMGKDVFLLMDSITRLARAYNLAIPTSGRTLSGGFDPAALFPAKKFFGAARNIENGGSLTIIGRGRHRSRMDDLIYEEFKGTGNMEYPDRRLAERRVFRRLIFKRSGTRKRSFVWRKVYPKIVTFRKMMIFWGRMKVPRYLERLAKSKK